MPTETGDRTILDSELAARRFRQRYLSNRTNQSLPRVKLLLRVLFRHQAKNRRLIRRLSIT